MLLLSQVCQAAHRDLGTLAETYPVAEPNALKQIQHKARTMTFELEKQKIINMVKNFRPTTIRLERAEQDRTFRVRTVNTLDADITDQYGRIIYPEGYKFNPLEHIANPAHYVFIDGTDPDQIQWFNESPYATSFDTVLMITDGRWIDVMKSVKFRVYYALPAVIDKFQIRAVPAVVKQENDHLVVREIYIEPSP